MVIIELKAQIFGKDYLIVMTTQDFTCRRKESQSKLTTRFDADLNKFEN